MRLCPADRSSPSAFLTVREKEAVLASNPHVFFTIPHFDGYSAVLIELEIVTKRALREAIVDGWLACAPPRLAHDYLKH